MRSLSIAGAEEQVPRLRCEEQANRADRGAQSGLFLATEAWSHGRSTSQSGCRTVGDGVCSPDAVGS